MNTPSPSSGAPKAFRLAPPRESREPRQRPLDLALVRRLWAYTGRYPARRTALFVLTVVRLLQLPILGYWVGRVLSGPIASGNTAGLAWSVAGFVGFLLLAEIVFMFRIRLALELGESLVHDLRNDLAAHLLAMPMRFFMRMPLGRLVSRFTSDVENVRLGVQDAVFVGVVQLGCMLGAAVLMAWQDIFLFLIVLALVPILWKLLQYFHARLYRAHTAMHESFARVTTTLAETVGGIRLIQSYGRQRNAEETFRDLIYDHSRYNLRVTQHNAVFAPLLELNGQLFMALLIVVGGYEALHGGVKLGALIHFMFLANLFFAPIPILAVQYNQALAAMAGAERVFRLLDAPGDGDPSQESVLLPVLRGRVEWRNVAFAYEADVPVLHDVSFTVEAGQTLAIVGETGGGKSTLLALTAKLYLPTQGQILLDGYDVRTAERASLRSQMGIVQQQNFLWSGTVFDNIRFARPEATVDEVRKAARALDVLDLLEGLPRGLDTEVGEGGSNLSLGQRQLVCFTRAMLADPRILLLDEATSAIDTITEARLQKALRLLLKGRTSFVVAHRLSTVRDADQILVMAAGRIVERGSFDELIRMGGHFAALYHGA